jgi:hypothetical protein
MRKAIFFLSCFIIVSPAYAVDTIESTSADYRLFTHADTPGTANSTRLNSGSGDWGGMMALVGLVACANYLVPEYIMEYRKSNLNHGLAWQFPFGFMTGNRMSIFMPYYCRMITERDNIFGAMYYIEIFSSRTGWNGDLYPFFGAGYVMDDHGHGPRGSLRLNFGDKFISRGSFAGLFADFSYVRDVKQNTHRFFLTAGYEWYL